MRSFTQEQPIFTAKGATGIGEVVLVEDFITSVLSLNTASNANVTIKFAGSIQDDKPDFASAQSAANRWDYIEVKDLEDGSAIDGDTGVVLSGTDDHRLFEANVNGLKWITAIITAYAAGAVTVKTKLFAE